MATYALTVSTNALGLGVISGATVVVERKRTTVTDIYPTSSLYTKKAATNISGIATIQLEADDGSVFHEVKIFDTDGVLVYKNTIQMPPQAADIEDLPLNNIINESAYQAVQAKEDTEQLKADTLTLKNAAQTSETNAANSASAASTSATNANNSANAALTNATNAANSADNAATSATNASNAQLAAEVARDAANATGKVYASTTAGISATTSGQYFNVVSAGTNDYVDLYLNSSGTAVYQKTYPSTSRINNIEYNIQNTKNELSLGYRMNNYIGDTSDVIPIIVDSKNKIIFGYGVTKKSFFGVGLGIDATNKALNAFKQAGYVGNNIYPILTDYNNVTLLGYNQETQEIFGAGLDSIPKTKALLGSHNFAEFNNETPVVIPIITDKDNKVLLGYDTVNNAIFGAGLSNENTGAISQNELNNLAEPLGNAAYNHIITYGQSLSVGARGQNAISTTQPYSNVTFHGGPRAYNGSSFVWSPFKPLIEDNISPAPDGGTNRGETLCAGLANYATTLRAIDGYTPSSHVILASAAGKGGTPIASLKKGSSWYNTVFLDHITQAHAINSNHIIQVVCWIQGESDNSTTYSSYYNDLNQLVSDFESDSKVITGQISPVYTLMYQTSAYSAANSNVQKAQLDVCSNNAKALMITPIYHIPHASDALHLNNIGYKWLGAYFGRAYKQMLDGKKPKFLRPLSATMRNSVIRVRFDVPVRPMVLDVISLASTINFGFVVTDTLGSVAISNITIDGDDVVIALSATPTGTTTVRYAIDNVAPTLNLTSSGSGNLRDSAPEKISISGVERNLYNVCPHFSLSVTSLGE